jgi:hypothetical protein
MLPFRQFIVLFEAKLDDIKKGIATRHKAETGEDIDPAELHDVVSKAKKIPGVDLSKSSFRELKTKVDPGIKQLHHNSKTGVTINEVTKKNSCVKNYGHGKTNWCVAATGRGNTFDAYAKGGKRLITIHHNGDMYAYHQVEGSIRNSQNDETLLPTEVEKELSSIHGKHPLIDELNDTNNLHHLTQNEKGKSLNPKVQILAMQHKDPTVAHKVIDNMGSKLSPLAQYYGMKHKDPTVAHKVIDNMGSKLSPLAQREAMQHTTLAHKVIDNMGSELDSVAQSDAILIKKNKDSTLAHKVIDNMGSKLDRSAQHAAMQHKDSTLAHKVIDNMGSKLDSVARRAAMHHKDPTVRIKAK